MAKSCEQIGASPWIGASIENIGHFALLKCRYVERIAKIFYSNPEEDQHKETDENAARFWSV